MSRRARPTDPVIIDNGDYAAAAADAHVSEHIGLSSVISGRQLRAEASDKLVFSTLSIAVPRSLVVDSRRCFVNSHSRRVMWYKSLTFEVFPSLQSFGQWSSGVSVPKQRETDSIRIVCVWSYKYRWGSALTFPVFHYQVPFQFQ